jgi:SH3-like domain-containing protein
MMRCGTIIAVIDAGTVVSVFIQTDDGLDVVHADGNCCWRRAQAQSGVRTNIVIEYEREDWGGLAWFIPLESSSPTS